MKLVIERGAHMKLNQTDFQLFDREIYTFKQLKEQYSAQEIEEIKAKYKKQWQKWKTLQLEVAKELPAEYGMKKPKVESWTNGWNLRSHFWSAYRSEDRQQENACLAVLLNKKQFQVYLMFQHYKSDERSGGVEEYNELLATLSEWSKQVAIERYYIWPQVEHELIDHLPLATYLADTKGQETLRKAMEDRSFQIGRLFFETDGPVEDLVAETTKALNELAPLYFALKQ